MLVINSTLGAIVSILFFAIGATTTFFKLVEISFKI